MDFKTHQHRLSQLSARFNLMVFLVCGLLASNILLSVFIHKVWQKHTVEITPFSGGPGYIKSTSQVDSRYLSLMAENFINERLNVTPETVDANHKRILGFADSKAYPEFLKRLNREAKVIKTKKISSTFDITQIKANPGQMTVMVTGVLKRYVGFKEIRQERLTYTLSFRYTDSRLSLSTFTALKEKNDA